MLLFYCLLFSLVMFSSQDVQHLSPGTFHEKVEDGIWYVVFCVGGLNIQCYNLIPKFKQFATYPEGIFKNVNYGLVDCMIYLAFCESHGIKFTPSIVLLDGGELVGEYSGELYADEFDSYLQNQLSETSFDGKIDDIDDASFDETVNYGNMWFLIYVKNPRSGEGSELVKLWTGKAVQFSGSKFHFGMISRYGSDRLLKTFVGWKEDDKLKEKKIRIFYTYEGKVAEIAGGTIDAMISKGTDKAGDLFKDGQDMDFQKPVMSRIIHHERIGLLWKVVYIGVFLICCGMLCIVVIGVLMTREVGKKRR